MSVLHLRNLSFIKIINAGEQYLVNNIDGNKALSVFDQICPEMQGNEIQALYDKHHKVFSFAKSP